MGSPGFNFHQCRSFFIPEQRYQCRKVLDSHFLSLETCSMLDLLPPYFYFIRNSFRSVFLFNKFFYLWSNGQFEMMSKDMKNLCDSFKRICLFYKRKTLIP